MLLTRCKCSEPELLLEEYEQIEEAESGRVQRIGVPGVWVSEVLLEDSDAELVVSKLGVDVDVDDGVRNPGSPIERISFGDP